MLHLSKNWTGSLQQVKCTDHPYADKKCYHPSCYSTILYTYYVKLKPKTTLSFRRQTTAGLVFHASHVESGPLTIGCKVRYKCGQIWEIFRWMSDNSAYKIRHFGTKVWYFVQTRSVCWAQCLIHCADEFAPNSLCTSVALSTQPLVVQSNSICMPKIVMKTDSTP